MIFGKVCRIAWHRSVEIIGDPQLSWGCWQKPEELPSADLRHFDGPGDLVVLRMLAKACRINWRFHVLTNRPLYRFLFASHPRGRFSDPIQDCPTSIRAVDLKSSFIQEHGHAPVNPTPVCLMLGPFAVQSINDTARTVWLSCRTSVLKVSISKSAAHRLAAYNFSWFPMIFREISLALWNLSIRWMQWIRWSCLAVV